ncbi:MAG: IS982 family transposase, partial [Acinetobacter sp.]
VRARDLWHLSHRFIRKILSHTVCVVMNKKCGYSPIQFEKLI